MTLNKIYRYFYTGQVDGMSMENVMRIMYCGKKYWVESLVDKCRLFIQENLSSDSACEVLHMVGIVEKMNTMRIMCVLVYVEMGSPVNPVCRLTCWRRKRSRR